MSATDTALPLRIGARTVGTLRRRLVRRRLTLDEALSGEVPVLPPLAPGEHGYLLTAFPAAIAGRLRGQSGLKPFVRQAYRRSYARLDIGFLQYLARFSAKTRSTLRRKMRRLADRSGGTLDIRCYRTSREIELFHAEARMLSAKTYQARRLGAGLPTGAKALERMLILARRDQARGFLLFVDGRPVSYLFAPAEGDTLIYAYLGYDPDFADFSPGTVLQLEAMRLLMEEKRFALFDFTEGEGQHKRLFATDGVDSVDLLLVRPTLGNLVVGHALNGFDGTVATVKRSLGFFGLGGLGRRFRR